MELNNIERLLEKYDNAETSLEEENQLKAFFAQENIPEHLQSYKTFFQYVNHAKEEHFDQEIPVSSKKTKMYQWLSIAAVVVIMLASYIQVDRLNQKTTLDDLSRDQLMAYHQTMEVFNLVSSKFNKGTDNLEALGLVSTKLNKGAEKLVHLKEFNKTTNKIINTK